MESIVKLASPIQYDSIVDGEGLRTVIWFQGCPHHCPGCHNPETHDIKKGKTVKLETIMKKIDSAKERFQDGITLSGGDPLFQPEATLEIVKYAKSKELNVWIYTGYLFEKLLKMDNIFIQILNCTDVIVDGPFMLSERSLNLKFRGSRNQRIIDVKKSLKKEQIVLISKYKKEKKIAVKH